MEYTVSKYRYNSNNRLYELIRTIFISEDQLTYVIGGQISEVKNFYRYDIKSESGNMLHQLFTIDASLFD